MTDQARIPSSPLDSRVVPNGHDGTDPRACNLTKLRLQLSSCGQRTRCTVQHDVDRRLSNQREEVDQPVDEPQKASRRRIANSNDAIGLGNRQPTLPESIDMTREVFELRAHSSNHNVPAGRQLHEEIRDILSFDQRPVISSRQTNNDIEAESASAKSGPSQALFQRDWIG